MHLSWSHKLFLRINKTLGKRPVLDRVMYFCGQWLIFILAGVNLVFLFVFLSPREYLSFATLWGAIFILAYGVSYTIALISKHPRPIKELPNIKELIIPLETWKSFPSDHSIAATLFTLMAGLVTHSSFVFFPIGVAALLVMVGRVYCGVHYPRDIIGGVFVALGSFALVFVGFLLYAFTLFY